MQGITFAIILVIILLILVVLSQCMCMANEVSDGVKAKTVWGLIFTLVFLTALIYLVNDNAQYAHIISVLYLIMIVIFFVAVIIFAIFIVINYKNDLPYCRKMLKGMDSFDDYWF